MAVIFVFVRDIKKMPVVSGGRLVGALSRRNVIDYLMGELEKAPQQGGAPRIPSGPAETGRAGDPTPRWTAKAARRPPKGLAGGLVLTRRCDGSPWRPA